MMIDVVLDLLSRPPIRIRFAGANMWDLEILLVMQRKRFAIDVAPQLIASEVEGDVASKHFPIVDLTFEGLLTL